MFTIIGFNGHNNIILDHTNKINMYSNLFQTFQFIHAIVLLKDTHSD